MQHFRSFVVLAVLAAALVPATAFAQQPSVSGYEGFGPQVEEEISQESPGGGGGGDEGGPTPAVAAQAGAEEGGDGNLPFTGLDLALVLGAGIVLLGMGIAMRRMVRPTEVA
jgi:hypothetical protein